MSALGADAKVCNTTGSGESGKSAQSSVANVTRTRSVVGMKEQSNPLIEKISLRKVDGKWIVHRLHRGVWDCRSWEDAHQIMLRLVNSDLRVARKLMLGD